MANGKKFVDVKIDDITMSGNNPRIINVDSASFTELSQSVKARGVIVPVHLRDNPLQKDKYELLAGERRLLAAQSAGLTKIPAINHGKISDKEAFEITYAENFAREDLTPLEQGRAVSILLEKYNNDTAAVASKMGKSERWVQMRAQVERGLSEEIKKIISEDKDAEFKDLTAAHLELIARFPDEIQKEVVILWSSGYGDNTVTHLEEMLIDYQRLVKKAPFDTKGCDDCTNTSQKTPMLFADNINEVSGPNNRCLNRDCWDRKEKEAARLKIMALKNEYPNLVLLAKEYLHKGNMDYKKLKEKYGKFLTLGDLVGGKINTCKKDDPDGTPVYVIAGKGEGKVYFVKLLREENQTKAKEPKQPSPITASQVPALDVTAPKEVEQARWAQTIDNFLEDLRSQKEELKKRHKFIAVFIAITYSVDAAGIKETKYLLDEYLKDPANALDIVIEKLFELSFDNIKWYMDKSGDEDSVDEARKIAGLFGYNLDAAYKKILDTEVAGVEQCEPEREKT